MRYPDKKTGQKNKKEIEATLIDAVNRTTFNENESPYHASMKSEDWILLARRAPYYEKLDAPVKAYINSIMEFKRLRQTESQSIKIFTTVLKQMGHPQVELYPNENLSDFYIPEAKIGIIQLTKPLTNLDDGGLNETGKYISECLTKQGITPVVLNINNLLGRDYTNALEDVVASLEAELVPNLNTEKVYDFAEIEAEIQVIQNARQEKRAQEEA